MGLPSYWPLLLGSDDSRTLARGGGGVPGLDWKLSFSSRVHFLKSLALSLDRRFPRAIDEKAVTLLRTCHV
jgi:hypothetical protein